MTPWLIDLHWVRALTVPMHLGLIDGPFVPHNLISAQWSPVPLTKFKMAPRLQILMSSGSKEGTQIYYPFLSKSPCKRIHSRFPSGAPMKRDTRLHISWCISLSQRPWNKTVPPCSPNITRMERDTHLRSLFYLSPRAPSKGDLPPGSLHRATIERDTPPPEPLSVISHSSHCTITPYCEVLLYKDTKRNAVLNLTVLVASFGVN
jgi:hypothetical protein